MAHAKLSEIARPVRTTTTQRLLEIPSEFKSVWWGMPSFAVNDISPKHTIQVHFTCLKDMYQFAKAIGIEMSATTKGIWYPKSAAHSFISCPGRYYYDGPKTDSRYPVCIPSKGRAEVQTTGKVLDQLGVSYRFFVEETEYDAYCNALGEEKVVKLPFHDLGQGSIPARNHIWEWAKEHGHKRHWVVDDNILAFRRCTLNRRLRVKGGGFFLAMEDFVDRYENIAMAGPHDQGFMPSTSQLSPYLFNSRVYSCILLDTALPQRWRGRYNEDTDLSLRFLKAGYCTCLFRAFLMQKHATAFAKGKAMKGGNTDTVYKTSDHRLAFAESLKKQHPDCVDVTWRFNRWHHMVNYTKFKNNQPILRQGVTPVAVDNEYGMVLTRRDDSEE